MKNISRTALWLTALAFSTSAMAQSAVVPGAASGSQGTLLAANDTTGGGSAGDGVAGGGAAEGAGAGSAVGLTTAQTIGLGVLVVGGIAGAVAATGGGDSTGTTSHH